MTPALSLVTSAALTLITLLVGSLSRAKAWTPAGFIIALGNRDNLPEPTAFSARADRTAKNQLEGLLLFTVLLAAAHWAQVADSALATYCALFVYARIAYVLVYWAGLKYVRTLVWAIGVAALFRIGNLVLA